MLPLRPCHTAQHLKQFRFVTLHSPVSYLYTSTNYVAKRHLAREPGFKTVRWSGSNMGPLIFSGLVCTKVATAPFTAIYILLLLLMFFWEITDPVPATTPSATTATTAATTDCCLRAFRVRCLESCQWRVVEIPKSGEIPHVPGLAPDIVSYNELLGWKSRFGLDTDFFAEGLDFLSRPTHAPVQRKPQ